MVLCNVNPVKATVTAIMSIRIMTKPQPHQGRLLPLLAVAGVLLVDGLPQQRLRTICILDLCGEQRFPGSAPLRRCLPQQLRLSVNKCTSMARSC